MKIIVTGGSGFIGSAIVRLCVRDPDYSVLNIDKLTYAGNQAAVAEAAASPRYRFVEDDITDQAGMSRRVLEFAPDAIVHVAAESHVDRSIVDPAGFIHTNIVGTCVLLEAAREYWSMLDERKRRAFRFLHVSTDEVYGSIDEGRFSETSPCRPSSPYAASKAAADHLVGAWSRTWGLPVLVTRCSNNYGPYQNLEKLIPRMIACALQRAPLPVYGTGGNVRDWLHVDDHAAAVKTVLEKGRTGEIYNVGAGYERTNLDVVGQLCELLDVRNPLPDGASHRTLISFVEDRPGHDLRYALDSRKIRAELGWHPQVEFEDGLSRTVEWYLAEIDDGGFSR